MGSVHFHRMKCPNCGAPAAGKFCSQCGGPLAGAGCRNCAAPLQPGARFCTNCGTRVGEARKGRAQWLYAGLAAAALIALAGVLLDRESAPVTPASAGAPGAAAGGSPPALSDNMRENADRLFNRVMQTREQGDTAGAAQFLPMAIQAYQSSGELDADGFYHLSVLQSLSGAGDEALQSAQRILVDQPSHLLGLHAAAWAARALNDRAQANRYYELLLKNLPAEKGRSLVEYQDHSALIDGLDKEAREYIARR